MINSEILEQYIYLNYRPRKRRVSSPENGSFVSTRCCIVSNIIDDGSKDKAKSKRSLDELIGHIDDTFQEKVFTFINEKNLDELEVYKSAHLDRKLFSKLRCDKDYKPSKKTAEALCFGLKLNIDESIDLLKRAGYTLSYSNIRDVIIRYFLENEEYDLDVLNMTLDKYGETSFFI